MTPQKKRNNPVEPKKARKAIEELHELVNQLKFFYGNGGRFREDVLDKAIYIEDVLHELSIDKKIDHAKFISKFKHLFAKENKELKEELNELKQVVKDRGEKIQELIDENKELIEEVVKKDET